MTQIIIIIIAVIAIITGALLINGPSILPGSSDSPNDINNVTSNDQVDVLNLSNQGLTSVPSYVFNLRGLEELNLSNNKLNGAIQAEIRHLANLRVLNASYNNMTGVPAEVGQLQNLEILDLSHNQLTGLPYELGNLQNLKTLNLSGNNYSAQDLDYIRSKLPSTVNIIVD